MECTTSSNKLQECKIEKKIIYYRLCKRKNFNENYSVIAVSYTHLDVYKRQRVSSVSDVLDASRQNGMEEKKKKKISQTQRLA